MSTMSENPLGMSDEEFQKLGGPPEVIKESTELSQEEQDAEAQRLADESEKALEEQEQARADSEREESEKEDEKEELEKDPIEKPIETGNLPVDKTKIVSKTVEKQTDESKTAEASSSTGSEDVDYKGFYEKIMAPLKANGKAIDLKSPDEAIQLMQMGANYTRKMQGLAPHRKLLLMLENNGLLDEGKLSYLIDIEKKNPEAIKKLIKDSGLDPRDIDIDETPAYQEGNHRVSDEEEGFRTTLDELSSNPDGRETLQTINTQWDQASKDILWKQPEVMTLIHQQRESGIYALISTELERQKTLGNIPPNVPFLTAYKKLGDDLAAAGAFDELNKGPDPKPQAQLVVTRVAAPKAAVKNGDKASAASTSRNNSRKAETVVNPLALSDDEFKKEFARYQGRV